MSFFIESVSACSATFPLRIFSFFLSLAIFPSKYLGFNLKLALGIAGTCFFSALVVPNSGQNFVNILAQSQYSFSFSNQILDLGLMGGEIIIGFILAIFVSVIGYAAQLWAKLLTKTTETGDSEICSFFYPAMLLFFWYVIFTVVDLSQLFLMLAQAFHIVPCGHYGVENLKVETVSGFFEQILLPLLRPALILGLIVALPVFVVSIAVDFIYLVLNRYDKAVVTNSLLLASKLPVIVLVISFSLYVSMGKFVDFFNQNLIADQYQAILVSLRGLFVSQG